MPLNGVKRKENKMSKFKRLVFFGGTFDPWTPAHEEIALKLSETPDTLVVITPTAITRHREGKEPLYNACERSRIIWHRIGKCESRHESSKFTINDHELSLSEKIPGIFKHRGFLQTVYDFLGGYVNLHYKKFAPFEELDIKFAIGSDEWNDISSWKCYKELLELAKPIVILRGGNPAPEGVETIELPVQYNNISASEIREKLRSMNPVPDYSNYSHCKEIWGPDPERPSVLLRTPIFSVLRTQCDITGFSPIQVKAPDWVTMIAKYGDNFVLVKQHRWGIDKDCVEFVTGQIDEGEEPRVAACRELKEETGWSVNLDNVEYLGSTYTNPAFMTNQMHYFFVDLDKHGIKSEQSLDEHEKIEVIEGTLPEEIPALMLAGVHLLERRNK